MTLTRTAIVFPGQGAQYPGMMKTFYQSNTLVRQLFDRASDILDIDLKTLCFEGPRQLLTRTDNAQPALLTAGYALYQILKEELDQKPAFLAGHSLGEITALTCAGVLDFEDALKLARTRGLAMHEATTAQERPTAMKALLGLEIDQVAAACEQVPKEKGIVTVANHNMETQIVLSGHTRAVDEAAAICVRAGATIKEVDVSAPFHSPLMAPVAAILREALNRVALHPFQVPVIANITAMPYTNHFQVPLYLERQVTAPVRWHDTIQFFKRAAVASIIETGPNQLLTKMLKRSNTDIPIRSFAHKK